jgi:hypothetical protein
MSTIVLRSVKGTPLTNAEVDANFDNLNTDKLQLGGTYSSGTANGVAYLNGSKVLTTGSALTFDGSLLTTPTFRSAGNAFFYGSTGDRLNVFPQTAGSGVQLLVTNNANSAYAPLTLDGSATIYNVNGSEQMRLTSTGLGIGTSSPGERLNVVGGGATTSTLNVTGGNNTDNATIASDYSLNFQVDANNNIGGRDFNWRYGGKGYSDGTLLMTLNSSGNLGLWVTPSAWFSNRKALQIGGSVGVIAAAGLNFDQYTNGYIDASTVERYYQAGAANKFSADSGTFKWFNAASGSANAAISFTQAMTLDASGNLGVGTTSPTSGWRLDVQAARALSRIQSTTGTQDVIYQMANTGGNLSLGIDNSTGSNQTGAAYGTYLWSTVNSPMVFATNNTERARIDSSGNLLVGSTSNAGTNRAFFYGNGGTVVRVGDGTTNSWRGYVIGATSGDSAEYGFLKLNASSGELQLYVGPNAYGGYQTFYTAGAERARIDSSGRWGINTTVQGTNPDRVYVLGAAADKYALHLSMNNAAYSGSANLGSIRIDGQQGRGQGINTGISIDINEVDQGNCTGINAKVTGVYNTQYAVYQEISKNLGAFSSAYCNYATMATTSSGGSAYFYYAYDQNSAGAKFFVGQNGGISNYQANNTNLSDRREKTNFAPAKSYLETICAIPVQTFNYTDQNMEDDAGLTLGVVAQDVQAVAPELVVESNWGTEEDPKMRLSIYQTDLQYALMKALQELKAEFDAYKASHP